MNYSITQFALGLLLAAKLLVCAQENKGAEGSTPKPDETGFEKIFNGQNLEGWGGPTDSFEVKEGALMCKPGEGGTIYTQDPFANFVVRLEYQLSEPDEDAHGLAIRYPGSGSPAYVGMCRIQIRDDKQAANEKLDPREKNGSAYGLAAARQALARPPGEWNALEVTVNGSTIKVNLNGTMILDEDLSAVTDFLKDHPHPGKDRRAGHFGVVASSENIKFRNIRIKRLARTRAS